MKLLSRPFQGTGLAARLLSRDSRVIELFPGDPRSVEAYREKAAEVDSRLGSDRRGVAELLRGGGPGAAKRISAFVEKEGYLVTTGQQPGLFGGPLLTLYKALTAAGLAARLEAELGRPVLPVFWVASEDHDWEEARATHLLDPHNEIHEIGLPAREGLSQSLHRIPIGPGVSKVLDDLLGLLPETEFFSRWAGLARAAYDASATLPSAFETMLSEILGPFGVFLVQAHEPGLKARSLEILLRELRQSQERVGELQARSERIAEAGHDLQVPIAEDATNLFFEGPAGRERVLLDPDGFRLRASGQALTGSEIEEAAREDPARLTPNVLLRPVVEASVLPTLSLVAGPAETAYLAQVEPLFRAHGVAQPVVHPRASLVVVESKVSKVLDKFDLSVEELAAPTEEIAARLLREEIPEGLRTALEKFGSALERRTGELRSAARALDPTLEGAMKAFTTRAVAHLSDLERKILASVKRQNETTLAQIEKARANLYPLGKPQERVIGLLQYLVRYDRQFLDAVAAASADAVLPPSSKAS